MLADLVEFITTRTPFEFLTLFWYFFVFELTRYVMLDVVLIAVYFERRYLRRENRLAARKQLFSEKPLVSVIAPGKNEGKHIPKLIASLREQTYSNLEIIIVDDGSDDDTPQICRKLHRKGLIDKFFRNDQRGGKASAANLALRYCTGRFVVHLDADSHLRSDALERILVPFYQDPKVGAVGGDIRVANLGCCLVSNIQGIEYMKSLSVGRAVNSMLDILRIISGAYGAFRTDALKRIHGWDPGPGLDGDITLRFRKLGYKVVHIPQSACYTNVPVSFTKLAKQRYRWERSLIRFRFRKHRDLLDPMNANFNVLNTLTVIDNILYNFIFNIKWWIYFIQIAFFNTDVLHYILIINYGLYTLSNFIEYAAACLLFGKTLRSRELALVFFVPLMPIYQALFLRTVRTYAHIMELFFSSSYTDPWNPWKVSKHAKKTGM